MPPTPPSKCTQYTRDSLDLEAISNASYRVFGQKPFQWQLEASAAVLAGEDVILDVATGCRKSLCFLLPLVLCMNNIAITVLPLTALMIEQVVNIDKVHCITVWGGSFRPDFSALGELRGQIPNNMPILVASATMPKHVLEDVRQKMQLSTAAKVVAISNERPNVALSVQLMKKPEKTMGNLQFLILPATCSQDEIPTTLVYCNKQTSTEVGADYVCDWAEEAGLLRDIVFYHALVGTKRKWDLERLLASGTIHVLFCTNAVGMGCDMRNIQCVILWGLPSTFCALVQQADRAGHNLSTMGEAMHFVTPHAHKSSLASAQNAPLDLITSLTTLVVDLEALNHEPEDEECVKIANTLDVERIWLPETVKKSDDKYDTGI
ncbi:hypothetical protein CVT24_012970 [Panaeolus cyanescens]|uniref:DNA 3'-5' helicase n=1 Tax=Panaeolus cyanescens TaxID=181874 RepID=A0A409YUG7_9AGAR|nr:hypothetical protein CVT24_012970 [Panaeolus cyanescens]